MEAIPRNKQLGYYSDAYKLEFILPKFRMYKRILADVLASDFCQGKGWTEERAIDLGKQILRGNVEQIFGS
jgi:glucuronate isomerase